MCHTEVQRGPGGSTKLECQLTIRYKRSGFLQTLCVDAGGD